MTKSDESESKFLVLAVTLVLLTLMLWGPIRSLSWDLLLRVGGAHANGEIVSAEEDIEEGSEGQSVWFHSAVYTFQTSDGEQMMGAVRGTGRLREDLREIYDPVPVVVEYLPRYPTINAPRFDRQPQPWSGLIWRSMLALTFVSAWIYVLVLGVRAAARRLASG